MIEVVEAVAGGGLEKKISADSLQSAAIKVECTRRFD